MSIEPTLPTAQRRLAAGGDDYRVMSPVAKDAHAAGLHIRDELQRLGKEVGESSVSVSCLLFLALLLACLVCTRVLMPPPEGTPSWEAHKHDFYATMMHEF